MSRFLALALAVLARQGPERTASAILDGVAVQAGEGVVPLSSVERALKRAEEKEPSANRQEAERRRVQLLRRLWTSRLEEQYGADLGLDPEQIGRISRLNVQEQRDREGLAGYLEQLRDQGTDALAEESDTKQEILRYYWEQRALGRAYAASRATRDQGIRPGELLAIYEENKDRLDPVTVKLRVLAVSSEALGSPEAAKASCEEARARVVAGVDLALLVEERGAMFRDTLGLTDFVPPRAIRDTALAAFAESAAVDDLSEVLPLLNPKTGKPDPSLGYQVAELVERRAPPIPEFTDPKVQRLLREWFTRGRDELVLGRAQERIRRESYRWLNPLLSGPAEAPAAPPGQ